MALPSKQPSLLRTLFATGAIVIISLSLLFLFPPKAIRSLLDNSTDLLLKTSRMPTSDIAVVLVEIDETSLKNYGQWPWPRNLIAELLDTIHRAGAASIGINIIFPERDRSSPLRRQDSAVVAPGAPADPANIPATLLDHDLVLAKSLAAGPVVLGYEFLFHRNQGEAGDDCPLPPLSLSLPPSLEDSRQPLTLHKADKILCSHRPLTMAAESAGFLNGAPDTDGTLRRLPLLMEYGDHLYPSFALAVFMRFYNLQELALRVDTFHLLHLSLGEKRVRLDSQGNILLGPPDILRPDRFSAADILAGRVNTDQLRNKIVLVGTTAQGLAHGFPTPYSSNQTLLDLHASAIRSLDSGIQPVRHPLLPPVEAGLGLLLSLPLTLICSRWPAGWSVVYFLFTLVVTGTGARMLLQYTGLLASPLLPSAIVFVNGCLFIILKYRHYQLQAMNERSNTLLLLKSSETNLRSILHTVPDIIFRLDPLGKIIFISPAICKYTQSPQLLLGSSVFSYIAPADLDKARFRLNERRTGKRATYDLEIRLMLNNGNPANEENFRFFSISAEGLYRGDLPANKGFIGTQGIAKDITDRKKLEFQLVQAQKMEAIGNLAAGIAHDLNNILSGLVSYPDLLLLEIPKENPLHGKIALIQKSGQKAAAIVQDLLSLARRNIAISAIININQIIVDYLQSGEFRQLQTRYPAIVLDTNLDRNLRNVKGSAVHFSKVIMNLVHNGMEAMPGGGRILIATNNVDFDSPFHGYEPVPAGSYVRLSVADEGVGISTADLPRIFEPFFTRKAMNNSGTGLGMTIIWATVKDHLGYLDIHSQEGQGTTLTIYLPATSEDAGLQPSQVVLEDYLGSGNILVVDDNPEQLLITANMLNKLGYTIHTAKSGEEAVAMVEKQPFDLVILDMIMPGGIDGLETFTRILGISPRQKALVTSGYSKSDRVSEMQKLGAAIFVQKPFTMEEIGMAVKSALGGNR